MDHISGLCCMLWKGRAKPLDSLLAESDPFESERYGARDRDTHGSHAAKAAIRTKIGNHPFRATGITEYLRNGGKLKVAQQMANHESARTMSLYDRRTDQVSLDEVERIVI
mgnify:FL=1